MRKSRFTEWQIVAVLKEVESGVPVAEVIRKHEISRNKYLLAILVCVCSSFADSFAETLRVPSEYPTIQDAVDACSPNDMVLVAGGIYDEMVSIGVSSISLVAETANGAVISHPGPVVVVNGDSCTIDGFVIQSEAFTANSVSLSLNGNAFLVKSCLVTKGNPCVGISGDGALRECVVSLGRGDGGITVLSGGDVLLERCNIIDNVTSDAGAGIAVGGPLPGSPGSEITLRDCQFLRNEASVGGGAIQVEWWFKSAHSIIAERCLFADNRAPVGAAVASFNHALVLRSCTFVGNSSPSGNVGSSVIHMEDNDSQLLIIERCIVAFNDCPAFSCQFGGIPTIQCCDVFGNRDDSLCGLDGGSNLSLDPLFCAPGEGVYTIADVSRCAPAHSPGNCGLIGAFDPSCVTAVLESTWGTIKHRFAQGRRQDN
jgi:Right handed beta helix region